MFNLIYHKFGNWIHFENGIVCVWAGTQPNKREKPFFALAFHSTTGNFIPLFSHPCRSFYFWSKTRKLIIINCICVLSLLWICFVLLFGCMCHATPFWTAVNSGTFSLFMERLGRRWEPKKKTPNKRRHTGEHTHTNNKVGRKFLYTLNDDFMNRADLLWSLNWLIAIESINWERERANRSHLI